MQMSSKNRIAKLVRKSRQRMLASEVVLPSGISPSLMIIFARLLRRLFFMIAMGAPLKKDVLAELYISLYSVNSVFYLFPI